jgi:hypothetical protein
MIVSSIRSLLRVLIDEPTTAKWSNANLNSLIFSEYRDLTSAITERSPDYYVKSASVATVASTDWTDLPSDCTLLKKLVNSEGETILWQRSSQFNHTADSSEPICFDVVGRHIWWSPQPDAVYSYTAYYHYMPTDLSGESDVPELPPNFHDILAYGTAVKSRMAKEDNIAQYHAIYQQKLGMLLHQIGISQTNFPRRVLKAVDAYQE